MIKQDNINIKGAHFITLADISSDKAKKIERIIISNIQRRIETIKRSFVNPINNKILHNLWEEYRYFIDYLNRFFKTQEFLLHNITTTIGRNVLARRLSGNTTYTGIVNYTALGTNNTAPAITDTQLGTETYRKALSSGTYSNNIAYLETFYTAAEVSGTFEEYGMFIDGNAAANSGQIFNRFIQTITKSVVETMNVQSTVTFSDI